MGELYINGLPLTGDRLEYCDQCHNLQPVEGGYTITYDELAIMWICLNCRSTS